MKYEYYIGLRYLRARRKQAMISIITGISILGVGLGVAALIIVLAVMTGFEEDLREKILGMNAHVVIVPNSYEDHIPDYDKVREQIRAIPDIKAVEVFTYSKAMISHGYRSDGIVLKGLDVARDTAADLRKFMVKGSVDDLMKLPPGRGDGGVPLPKDGIILGEELAISLGARLGETVNITTSRESLTPVGMIPRSRAFRVVGLFRSGMFEYDSSMAYLALAPSQTLFGINNGVNGFELRVNKIFDTPVLSEDLRQKLGSRFWVRDWKDMNQTFFAALKLEKMAMFIILTLIIFVASFNIISSLTMMVMEKHKDIGILKAMGATNRGVHLIFLTQGVIIGLVGTVLGCVAGTTLSWIADTFQLIKLQGEVYYISFLPFKVQLSDVVAICSASLIISFLATIYPARQASRLDPVEAIRYE